MAPVTAPFFIVAGGCLSGPVRKKRVIPVTGCKESLQLICNNLKLIVKTEAKSFSAPGFVIVKGPAVV